MNWKFRVMRRNTIRIAFLWMLSPWLVSAAEATTWADGQEADPFSDGTCHAPRIKSYGGYIYAWPSKYDLVYWPHIDPNWLWYCPKSGYASFGDDFSKLKAAERESVKTLLAQRYQGGIEDWKYRKRLLWAAEIYRAREKNLDFWASFYSLLTYLHSDEPKKAEEFVRKAVPLYKRRLETLTGGMGVPTLLYILGEYHRRLGKRDAARDYFNRAKNWSGKLNDRGRSRLKSLLEMVAEREALLD